MAVLRLPPPLRRSKQNASAEIPYPCPSSDGDTPAAPKLPAPEACTAILPAASATPSSCRAGLSKLTALPHPAQEQARLLHQSLDLSIHVRHTSSCREEWDCRRLLLPKRVTRSTKYATRSAASHHSKFHPAMQHVFLCQPAPGCPFAPQLPAGKGRRYLIAHPVVPSARATPRRPRSSMANQVAIAATKSPYRTAALHSFGARNVSPPTITTTCQSERIPALFHHSNIGSSKSTFKRASGNVGRAGDEARRRGLLHRYTVFSRDISSF